jgi:hypothetical protein
MREREILGKDHRNGPKTIPCNGMGDLFFFSRFVYIFPFSLL